MKSTIIFLISLISATPAFAQVQATSLGGIVTDAQGAVLPGVTVTATSPALIGTQTTVSEPNGRYRFASVPEGLHADVRAERLSSLQTRQHRVVAGPDADRRRTTAAAVAAGKRHGHGGITRRRRADDERRIDTEHDEADRRAHGNRLMERAGALAGCAHAGLRRRRQPQERADRVRGVRRPRPIARRHGRRGHHGRLERRRLLPGLLRAERNRGQRGRAGRDDEYAWRGGHLDDQERRQPVSRDS